MQILYGGYQTRKGLETLRVTQHALWVMGVDDSASRTLITTFGKSQMVAVASGVVDMARQVGIFWVNLQECICIENLTNVFVTSSPTFIFSP